MHDLPGSLRSDVDASRSSAAPPNWKRCGRSSPRAAGRRPACRSRRRRARLGQEPSGAGVRRRGGERRAPSSSTAPATRSCTRRTGRSSRRSTSSRGSPIRMSCAIALGTTGGELTRLLPDLPARVGDLPPPIEADPDTERHRLHTAVADLLGGDQQATAGAARARGRTLGGRPDAAAAASPRSRRRAAHACCCSRPSATPRPTCPRRSRRRSPTCADPRTSSGFDSAASRARRWPSSSGMPREAT